MGNKAHVSEVKEYASFVAHNPFIRLWLNVFLFSPLWIADTDHYQKQDSRIHFPLL